MTVDKAKVTVVVPTKNRPIALASLLGSLHCQSLLGFDVIIALNGNKSWHPYLDRLVIALRARQINVQIHNCFGLTFAELHEYMVNQSQTEYVCRLDDDHVPDPNYLSRLLNVMEENKEAGAVGGIILHPEVPGYEFSEIEFLNTLRMAKSRGVLNTILQFKRHPTCRLLQVPDLYSSFMTRVEIIQEVGGVATCYHSSGYREESDLTLRMTFAGFKQYIVPQAIVWHVKSERGGERRAKETWQKLRAKNENIFQKRVRRWCKDPKKQFALLWSQALAEAQSFDG